MKNIPTSTFGIEDFGDQKLIRKFPQTSPIITLKKQKFQSFPIFKKAFLALKKNFTSTFNI